MNNERPGGGGVGSRAFRTAATSHKRPTGWWFSSRWGSRITCRVCPYFRVKRGGVRDPLSEKTTFHSTSHTPTTTACGYRYLITVGKTVGQIEENPCTCTEVIRINPFQNRSILCDIQMSLLRHSEPRIQINLPSANRSFNMLRTLFVQNR